MKKQKILAFILSLTMITGAAPMTTMAASATTGVATELSQSVETQGTVTTTTTGTQTTTTTDADGTQTVTTIDNVGEGTTLAAGTYILINIPYEEFYKADLNNTVKVDAFSSATLNKTRTASLAGGSYHVNADGSDITGVTFPVKLTAETDMSAYTQVTDDSSVTITVTNRGQTSEPKYEGKDALFESATYSYYVLTEEPSYYKEMTAGEEGFTFGATQGEVNKIAEPIASEFTTESSYGDYQLNLDDETIESYFSHETDQIYGVIVSTKEGNDYGMRHLENIWLGSELSWCTGFTDKVHNCPTSSAHYIAMMGQTINKVTYYTSKGIYEFTVADTYVPVKFTHELSVTDAQVSDGTTAVSLTGLPEGYQAVYSVDGLADAAVADGKLFFADTAEPGTYTLTVTDASRKYADLTADFTLSTSAMPVSFDNSRGVKALTNAAGYTAANLTDYVKAIESVSVNGTSYAASGKGATTLINSDGSIKTDAAPFAEGDSFEITVKATGYVNDLTFTYTKDVAATSVSIDKTTVSLKKGETVTLKATIAPAASNDTVTWSSSDASIASVSTQGVVTAVKAGTATITATASSGVKAVSTITVTEDQTVVKTAQTITNVKDSYTVKYGKTITLAPKASGKLSYKVTTGSSVVSVTSTGKVSVKKAGTAKITITAAATNTQNAASKVVTIKATRATQKITAKVSTKTYKVSALKSAKKTFKISAATSKKGGKLTYTVAKNAKKYITVSKSGKVTVKKNTKKGTYKITVKAAKNVRYNAASKTITIKVK